MRGSGPNSPATSFDHDDTHVGMGPTDLGDLDLPEPELRARARYDGALLAAFVSVSLVIHAGLIASFVVFPALWQLLALLKPPPARALHFEPIRVDLIELAPPEPEPVVVETVAARGPIDGVAIGKLGLAGTTKGRLDQKMRAARAAKILGVLGSRDGTAHMTGLFGTGTLGSENVLGSLRGDSIGEGFGGLGLRGSGGGGSGEGIGGFGTIGRGGGGGGTGYGRGTGRLETRGLAKRPAIRSVRGIPGPIVERTVNRVRAQIRYCYQRELRTKPTLAGNLTVVVKIDASGGVSKVTEKSSTLPNAAVTACVQQRLRRLRFPTPDSSAEFVVSFDFVTSSS